MVKIHCLGGCREVGRNGFLIEGQNNIMLDFGLKVENNMGPLMPKKKADALFIAHSHKSEF